MFNYSQARAYGEGANTPAYSRASLSAGYKSGAGSYKQGFAYGGKLGYFPRADYSAN